MPDIGLFLLLQSLFDILLLFLVLLLYWQVRKLKDLPLGEALEHLQRANELCERLSANLAEKKEISERLLSALETGAKAWESSKSDAGDLKKQVAQLLKKGLSVEEIARRTGLQEGEVALIVSVLEQRRR